MSLEVYSVMLEPAQGGGYGVSFPLFPGCVSFGRSTAEAMRNAVEALQLHIAGMVEDGEVIPLEGYDDDGNQTNVLHAGGPVGPNDNRLIMRTFVTVDIGDKAGERINVYLPSRLVRSVDTFAARNGMTRSSVFGIAARRYLESEAVEKSR